jgi:hypothetical protein
LDQILLIIKSRGDKRRCEIKLDIQWLIQFQGKNFFKLAWAVDCKYVFFRRETYQRRRDDYETRGDQPDEEGGDEVVPFGNCPEADQHLHKVAVWATLGSRRRHGTQCYTNEMGYLPREGDRDGALLIDTLSQITSCCTRSLLST